MTDIRYKRAAAEVRETVLFYLRQGYSHEYIDAKLAQERHTVLNLQQKAEIATHVIDEQLHHRDARTSNFLRSRRRNTNRNINNQEEN